MIVPTRSLIHAYDDVVAPLYERIAVNQKQSCLLATIRDILLPTLMSGQIRVKTKEVATEDTTVFDLQRCAHTEEPPRHHMHE